MEPTFFSSSWNISAVLGKLMGPVEKIGLLVVTEGNKVSQGETARDCGPDSHFLSEKPRGEEAQRQRFSSLVPLCPVILPFSVQKDGVFVLKETQSSGGPCVYEMDFLHGLKGKRIVNVSMEFRFPKLPNHPNKAKSTTRLESCRDFNAGCCMAVRRQIASLTALPLQMDLAAVCG